MLDNRIIVPSRAQLVLGLCIVQAVAVLRGRRITSGHAPPSFLDPVYPCFGGRDVVGCLNA